MTALKVRGMALAASRAYAKERFNPAGWQRLCTVLPPQHVIEVWNALILPTGWYAGEIFDAFLDGLDATYRADEPRLGFQIGQRIAKGDIKFYHSLVMPFLDPGTVLSQSARLWHEYFDGGAMAVIDREAGGLRVTLDNPGVHAIVCREIIPGWGAMAITQTGAKVTRIEHDACVRDGAAACTYAIAWEK
jgi:hypothetical protein